MTEREDLYFSLHQQDHLMYLGSSGKRQHEEDKLIQSLTQSISSKLTKKSEGSKQNVTTIFSNYIASQWSELDAKTRAVAQQKINVILFQAQMGTLMVNEATQFPCNSI